MMTSQIASNRMAVANGWNHDRIAYVWIWLPEASEPIVAGRLDSDDSGAIRFLYDRSYLERRADNQSNRRAAMAIGYRSDKGHTAYEPELPLKAGAQYMSDRYSLPGAIRDAAPDAWGRRVILNKMLGSNNAPTDAPTNRCDLSELTYLLESGSDRIGALDFQRSPNVYVPRQSDEASLAELLDSTVQVENGVPISPALAQALAHGSSVGGARPKILIQEGGMKYIAKIPSVTDSRNVIKAEFIAMRLAKHVGLDVAPVRLVTANQRDLLLVERFDRCRLPQPHGQTQGEVWQRKAMISALTLLGLNERNEMLARYASYEDLAEMIRHRFTQPKSTLTELFKRLVYNILCGNSDDHARNHAAFWNGVELTLTPAYDICPQPRTGGVATQAMLISGHNSFSQLKTCRAAAYNFLLSEKQAEDIFADMIAVITDKWAEVCAEAEASAMDKAMWRRQFLNPYALET